MDVRHQPCPLRIGLEEEQEIGGGRGGFRVRGSGFRSSSSAASLVRFHTRIHTQNTEHRTHTDTYAYMDADTDKDTDKDTDTDLVVFHEESPSLLV
jgi:hypothetical protein